MAQYVCALCGNTYDEEAEGVLFADLADDWECPVCMGPKAMYKTEEASQAPAAVRDVPAPKKEANPLAWPEELVHHDGGLLDEIHTLAETGESVTEPMNTQMGVPGFDEIVVLGAQLSRPPLLEDEPVSLKTVIGKRAKKPMELQSPIYVSHMSFGALSKETKLRSQREALWRIRQYAAVRAAYCRRKSRKHTSISLNMCQISTA